MTKPIGILGGTFDPIHHGHLRMAIEVRQSCALAEVRLIPLHTPPHRQAPNTSQQQRMKMLQLAIEGVKGLVADDRELQRAGVSFTVDTLRSLREDASEQALCLIMGMDAFQKLDTWHEWASLISLAHIIVVRRPGAELELANTEVAQFYKAYQTTELSDLHTGKSGCIYNVDIAELNISSTRIRELVGTKQDLHFLLPENVISYIEEEDLYHRY
ncbi:MAG: nicotinate-nucleotide adenylyltransferase [Gammaproteobacteria bacterium]|jgi:nicotinate-nucleotide adenylyltransferase